MKRIILLILVGLLLAGCDTKTEEWRPAALPKELADCKFYDIWENGNLIRVVRCPNSVTTTNYRENKVTRATVVIDGVEYVKKPVDNHTKP